MGYGQFDSGRRLRSCIKGQGHMRRQVELLCPPTPSPWLVLPLSGLYFPSFPALASPTCDLLFLSALSHLLCLPPVAGQSVNKVADSCNAGALKGRQRKRERGEEEQSQGIGGLNCWL